MKLFNNLVDEYLLPEPRGFTLIAARLKAGKTPLEIRNQLMEETGASRLAVGKLVEQCEKAIKVAKANLIAGAGVFAAGLLLIVLGDLRGLFGIVIGAAQFAAGRRVWTLYRQAQVPEAV